jgi:pentatricopeptide repeat protein
LCEKAIDLFFQIKNPNEQIIVFFLNACAKLSDQHSLNLAKEFLNKINSNYKTNEFILCTASNMFLKCNQIKSAEEYLSKMSKSDIKYRMLMKICNLKNEPEQTFDLYNKMQMDGFKPNLMTYLFLINASSQIGIENICQKTVQQIPKNLLQNLTIQNALIDMWVRQISKMFLYSKINF